MTVSQITDTAISNELATAAQYNNVVSAFNALVNAENAINIDTITEVTGGTGVTVENILIKDGDLAFNNAVAVIRKAAADTRLEIHGGTGTGSGANIVLYGASEVAYPNNINFRADSTIVGQWDNTADRWEFKNAVLLESNVGFYGTAPIAQQTGVAVSDAAIHTALVNLGLITA